MKLEQSQPGGVDRHARRPDPGDFAVSPQLRADAQNPNATLETGKGGVCGDHTCSYFQVHTIRAGAAAGRAWRPFILAWIIVREHELSGRAGR